VGDAISDQFILQVTISCGVERWLLVRVSGVVIGVIGHSIILLFTFMIIGLQGIK